MPIPLAYRINVRTLLQPVATFTKEINDLKEAIRFGRKGEVTMPIADYIKLLSDARRVQYIVTGLAIAPLGIALLMPENKDAKMFRNEMDIAIEKQLLELENEKVDIILTDDNHKQM